MTATDTAAQLAQRYGRTPGDPRRNRRRLVIAAIALGALLVGWLVWAALDQTSSVLDTEDVGSRIVDDRSVEVSLQVSMPVGSTASCALQAQNEAHTIVGWRIVELPASARYTNSFTEVVKTSERAVTGLIYQCWLT